MSKLIYVGDDSLWGPWIERTEDDHNVLPDEGEDAIVQVRLEYDIPEDAIQAVKGWDWYYTLEDGKASGGTITHYRILLGSWSEWKDISELGPYDKANARILMFMTVDGDTSSVYGIMDYRRFPSNISNYRQFREFTLRSDTKAEDDLQRFRKFFSSNPVM